MKKALVFDLESIYQLLYAQRWEALVHLMHQHHAAIAEDPQLARAIEMFMDVFLQQLETSDDLEEPLEKLLLLHAGGFYSLSAQRVEQVVETLVALCHDRPQRALGFARFCPQNPRCAALLEQHDPPPRRAVSHSQENKLSLIVTQPLAQADATIGLFRSQQEVDFFMAVREVYATYFVYPNVALSCLVDFEQIKEQLSSEARSYFFKGVVDCVVFDQHSGYRPVYFFELDSALHDDESQERNDGHKERILALAGKRLFRIRRQDSHQGKAAFVTLLIDLSRTEDETKA